jgi:hypothetical protein
MPKLSRRMTDRTPAEVGSRYAVSLRFEDLQTGDFRTVYPLGMTAETVMRLLNDPGVQFAKVPPPPPIPKDAL